MLDNINGMTKRANTATSYGASTKSSLAHPLNAGNNASRASTWLSVKFTVRMALNVTLTQVRPEPPAVWHPTSAWGVPRPALRAVCVPAVGRRFVCSCPWLAGASRLPPSAVVERQARATFAWPAPHQQTLRDVKWPRPAWASRH
jgi:hypothetical protein